MSDTDTETAPVTPLVDRVLAAKAEVEAAFSHQALHGVPLTEAQKAEILIAQVKAIIGGGE